MDFKLVSIRIEKIKIGYITLLSIFSLRNEMTKDFTRGEKNRITDSFNN